jgi:hypothetical protein
LVLRLKVIVVKIITLSCKFYLPQIYVKFLYIRFSLIKSIKIKIKLVDNIPLRTLYQEYVLRGSLLLISSHGIFKNIFQTLGDAKKKGILSTSCVIFSYPNLLSIPVLTFIKWRLNTELLMNTLRNVVFSTKKADHRYRKLINYALTWYVVELVPMECLLACFQWLSWKYRLNLLRHVVFIKENLFLIQKLFILDWNVSEKFGLD